MPARNIALIATSIPATLTNASQSAPSKDGYIRRDESTSETSFQHGAGKPKE